MENPIRNQRPAPQNQPQDQGLGLKIGMDPISEREMKRRKQEQYRQQLDQQAPRSTSKLRGQARQVVDPDPYRSSPHKEGTTNNKPQPMPWEEARRNVPGQGRGMDIDMRRQGQDIRSMDIRGGGMDRDMRDVDRDQFIRGNDAGADMRRDKERLSRHRWRKEHGWLQRYD
jgi:hypothetical protein